MRLAIGLFITLLIVGVFVGVIISFLVDHTAGGGKHGPGGDTPTVSPTRRPTPPPTHFTRNVYVPAALLTADWRGIPPVYAAHQVDLHHDYSFNLADLYPHFDWDMYVRVLISVTRTGTDYNSVCGNYLKSPDATGLVTTMVNTVCIDGLSTCDEPVVNTKLPAKNKINYFAQVLVYFNHTNIDEMTQHMNTLDHESTVGPCWIHTLFTSGLTVSRALTTQRKVNFFQLDVNNMYSKHVNPIYLDRPEFNLCWETRCHLSQHECRVSDGACI